VKPFRFGASIAAAGSAKEWRETARKMESFGYSTLLLPDHFVVPFAPIPALMAAAEATSTLRIGTMVNDNDFRHPALLAKEVATADLLSDGRFEIGIGAGWLEMEYRAAGIPFDAPAVRIARLAEAITIMKGLFGEEPVTFKGEHYTIDGLQGSPAPLQRPHPPFMIGGGARRMLELAAREADIVSFAPSFAGSSSGPHPDSMTARGMDERVRWVREAAGGRDLELSNYYNRRAQITDDPRGVAEAALEQMRVVYGDPGLTVDDAVVSPHFLLGSVPSIVETLRARRERWGVSYYVFTEDACEAMAPVVEQLAGT